MKIAHLSEFYHPSMGGVQYHMGLLTNYFSKKNKVTVLTTWNKYRVKKKFSNTQIKDFKIKGNIVSGYFGEVENFQNYLINSNFDYLLFYAAQQWTFDLALPILSRIKGKKIFLPCGFSNFNKISHYLYYKNILKNKINNFDEIVCFSKITNDYNFCKKYYIILKHNDCD